MSMPTAYIIDTVRTPRGKRKGALSEMHPTDLASLPLKSLIERNRLNPTAIEDVLFGCVSQRGEQDNVIGRKAVMAAGLPDSIPGVAMNRFCGSGLTACNLAAHGIMSGMHHVLIAGGVEHMTRVPMEIDFNENSYMAVHYAHLVSQGESAELIADKFGYTRQALDEYAVRSQIFAAKAWENGHFAKSVVPVDFKTPDGKIVKLERDEHLRPGTTVESLAALKPVFRPDGRIHAGNASGIVDGAAAVLLASEKAATQHGLKPRAKIIATAIAGSDPVIMLLGPIPAIEKALQIADLKIAQIDLFEINEAFAPVPLAVAKELKIPLEKINVNGGAIALGHPLGATGAMLLGTLVDEMERRDLRYGCVSLCIGYGMGVATIIDRNV